MIELAIAEVEKPNKIIILKDQNQICQERVSSGETIPGTLIKKRSFRAKLPTVTMNKEIRFNQQLRMAIKEYSETSYGSFSQNVEKKLLKDLSLFLDCNYPFQSESSKIIEEFLNYTKAKTQGLIFFQSLFPRIIKLSKKLEKKTQYVGNRRRTVTKRAINNLLFQNFIQDKLREEQRQKDYIIVDDKHRQLALADHMGTFQGMMDENARQFNFRLEQSIVNSKKTEAVVQKRKRMEEFASNLHFEKLMSLNCLGCLTFMYYNRNIYDQRINNCKIALVGKVSKINLITQNIIEQICGLMNGNGGVALFDCSMKYLNVVPLGEIITNSDKIKYTQIVTGLLEQIVPKPEMGKQITVQFVPIVEDYSVNTHTSELDPSTKKLKRRYMKGRYVMRITVNPANNGKTYQWKSEDKLTMTIRQKSVENTDQAKRRLTPQQAKIFSEARSAEFSQYENLSDQQRFYVEKPVSSFDHICKIPEKGLQIIEKPKEIPTSFTNSSLIFCKPSDHSQIIQKLSELEIQAKIEIKFQKSKLSTTKNCFIISHNIPTSELSQIVKRKQFEFNGKSVLILPILEYIKLVDRTSYNTMCRQDLENLEEWLSVEFKDQSLRLWKFINENGDAEYYFKMENKEAAAYLYFLLNHFQQKAVFRMPKDINKMSENQINRRFTQQYPKQR